jgi:hypothetical protein
MHGGRGRGGGGGQPFMATDNTIKTQDILARTLYICSNTGD